MPTCVNCSKDAVIRFAAPGSPAVLFCAKHRPSFTFKKDYFPYVSPADFEIPVPAALVDEPSENEVPTAPKPKAPKKKPVEEAPSEAVAEETPTETAPEEEPEQ